MAACMAKGAECGDIVDDCSTTISCGSCSDGSACGTGAFANRCQCDPKSCDDQGAECGEVDDGCGVKLNCGGCTAPEKCGGAGTANQCGCTPTPHTTDFMLLRSARNVDANSGSVDWDELGDGVQFNSQGTNFSIRGNCGYEGGGGDGSGCGCCARARDGEGTSEYLDLTNAGFSLPAGATVRGIEAQINMKRNGSTTRLEELTLVGAPSSANPANLARSLSLSSDYKRLTFGGPTELWGAPWTAAQVNSANFGMRLQMYAFAGCSTNSSSCSATEPYIDAAQVRVHYETCE